MNLFALALKPLVSVTIGVVMMQMMVNDIPRDTRDPFTAQTTPPWEFQVFNEEYSTLDVDAVMDWISPELGLVKDGILLTFDEAEESFRKEFGGNEFGDIQSINLVYNFGEFAGASTFQSDCWVEWKTFYEGQDQWFRLHRQFVFKIVDQKLKSDTQCHYTLSFQNTFNF